MPRLTSFEKREKELNKLSRTELEKKLKKELPSQYEKEVSKGEIINTFLKNQFGEAEFRRQFRKEDKKRVARVEKILEKKTVAELRESATEFRIKGRSKMRKAELVKAVAYKIA